MSIKNIEINMYDCHEINTKMIVVIPAIVSLNSASPNDLSNKAVKALTRGNSVERYTTWGK